MIFDVTEFIATHPDFSTGLFALQYILVTEIGPQNVSYQGPFKITGDGWWVESTMMKGYTKWELYIGDDNLALMFKLKWL